MKRTTEYPSIDPYETSLLNTTFTEQVYETRVRPEEERFHSLFSRFSIKTGVRTGELVDSIATQAMFAQEYAEVCISAYMIPNLNMRVSCDPCVVIFPCRY
jgi:hypothetical protein